MTEQRWPGAGGDDDRADLDWLADQFVLGSLSAEDEQAVVDRLADDDALAAAVARSSRLVAALQASRVVAVQPASLALVACWPVLAPRSGPPATPDAPREVVRLWRQADETTWPEEDPLAEDEPVDGDAVPDWMLAAVGLDATSSLEPRVQEN